MNNKLIFKKKEKKKKEKKSCLIKNNKNINICQYWNRKIIGNNYKK